MPKNKPERNLKVPTGAILSKYLRCLALDVETVNPEGDPVTKAQVLAALVWKHALGFEQPKNPDKPDEGTTRVPPAVWAIDLLYNRIEGKVPVAAPEDTHQSLAEKVSELGKAKINSLSRASVEDVPEEETEG